jgi:hypothetical protein
MFISLFTRPDANWNSAAERIISMVVPGAAWPPKLINPTTSQPNANAANHQRNRMPMTKNSAIDVTSAPVSGWV